MFDYIHVKIERIVSRRPGLLAIGFCLLFVAVASLWISEIGIQNDEALFAAGMYPGHRDAPVIFGKQFPTMIMTYVGTLKAHLYKPIVRNLGASPATLRLPGIFLGALTIWWFYLLMKRTLGIRAALLGTALLATDASFILTTRWDWGPVVFQHLCMVGAMLAMVRFAEAGKLGWLAIAGFAAGLGLWDKAIFLWSLAGLGCAVLAVFPRRFLSLLSARAALVVCAAFLTGALPFLVFNFRHDFATFTTGTKVSLDPVMLAYKADILRSTVEGRALFGIIPRESFDGPVREPDDTAKRVFVAGSDFFGAPRRNFHVALLLLTVLLLPWVWKTGAKTAFLFAAVYVPVTWIQMALIDGAGTGAHHAVLMWPVPHLAMAAVLAEASRRFRPLIAVVAIACGASLLVVAAHYSNMLRNGGSVVWTDAIYPASEALAAMKPSWVCVEDWGFFETLRLLHRGRLPLCVGVGPDDESAAFRDQITNPGIVYIAHTDRYQLEPGKNERFLARANAEGYGIADQRVFHDYNGRPVIQTFQLAPRPYESLLEEWRTDRESRLRAPDGWLSVAGLTWLRPGANPWPGAGVFALRDGAVTFRANGQTRTLRPDTPEDFVAAGNVKLFVIHRGSRFGIRTKDNSSEFRTRFTRLDWYPADPEWRITAQYKPFPEPRRTVFDSETGDKQPVTIPGFVEFQRNGSVVRLSPVLEDDQLFFVFRDKTAGTTTYAAARFLYAPLPSKAGPIELDFNKAYNPPCVFTPYATCPLPPPENRMGFPIAAGEKLYRGLK